MHSYCVLYLSQKLKQQYIDLFRNKQLLSDRGDLWLHLSGLLYGFFNFCRVITSISQMLPTQDWNVNLGHRRHGPNAQSLLKIVHPNMKSETHMRVSYFLLCPRPTFITHIDFRGKPSFSSDFYFLSMANVPS